MRLRLFFILSLVVLLVCSCTQPNQTKEKAASDIGQPVQGDWAIVHFINEPPTLNPLTNALAAGDYAMTGANNSQIYELLLGYNTKDWDLTEPLLAEAPDDPGGLQPNACEEKLPSHLHRPAQGSSTPF